MRVRTRHEIPGNGWRRIPLAVGLVLFVAVAAVAVPVGAAEAPDAPDPGTRVDPPAAVDLRLTVRVVGPGTPGGGHVPTDLAPVYWKRLDDAAIQPTAGNPVRLGGAACDAAAPVPVPAPAGAAPVDPGTIAVAILIDRASGAVVNGSTALVQCLRPGAALVAPEPPTYADILHALQFGLGAPRPTYDPSIRGLTGLETIGTLDSAVNGPGEVTRTLTFGAWSVTAHAERVGFAWSVDGGDGGATVHERFAGATAATPFRYTFGTKGDFELGVEARWEVTDAVLVGTGVTATVAPLGTLFLGTARGYHVVEARGVLHANG